MKPIVKTFKNGLRAVVCPQKDSQTVTTLVLVSTGSKYESLQEHGISHFLEHMYFKGTLKRPSSKIINETLDGLGAVSNAFTSHEYTGYYAKGNPKHLGTFIDILSDIYINSTFSETEIQKEKGVIIEEMNMYEDMPQYLVGEELFTLLYGTQPAGRSIKGTKESVTSFKQKDFLNYRKKFYTAPNTVVVVSGNVNPSDCFKKIALSFKDLPKGKKNKKEKVSDNQKSPLVRIKSKVTDQAHMALAFHSVKFGDSKSHVISLLATILGRGMSSRLFTILREELGAAYYVSADQDSYTDHGVFSIASGIDKTRLKEIVKSIVKELVKIKIDLVSKEELIKAKEYTVGMMKLGLESSDSIANFYGYPLIMGKNIRNPDEIMKKIMSVTSSQIREMAKRLFTKNNANFALVGPFKEGDMDIKIFDSLK